MHIGLINTVLVQSYYSYLNNQKTLTLPDGRTPLLNVHRKTALISEHYPKFANV
jgi:hypothetical protein